MTSTNFFHSFECLVRRLIALNNRTQLTGNFSDTNVVWVAFGDDHRRQPLDERVLARVGT